MITRIHANRSLDLQLPFLHWRFDFDQLRNPQCDDVQKFGTPSELRPLPPGQCLPRVGSAIAVA